MYAVTDVHTDWMNYYSSPRFTIEGPGGSLVFKFVNGCDSTAVDVEGATNATIALTQEFQDVLTAVADTIEQRDIMSLDDDDDDEDDDEDVSEIVLSFRLDMHICSIDEEQLELMFNAALAAGAKPYQL